MLNHHQVLELLEKLRIDTDKEMTRDAIEQLLDEELAKPETEMDT